MINKVYPCSFKSFVPVTYYARNIKGNGDFVQVCKYDNLRKCNNIIVMALNGTKKLSDEEKEFVNWYIDKSNDEDYLKYPHVNSIIDSKKKSALMLTGYDSATIRDFGRTRIGIPQHEAKEIGINPEYVKQNAAKSYVDEMKAYLNINDNQLKTKKDDKKDGIKLALRAYFNPVYYTKGKNKGQLKGFEFLNARFVKDE